MKIVIEGSDKRIKEFLKINHTYFKVRGLVVSELSESNLVPSEVNEKPNLRPSENKELKPNIESKDTQPEKRKYNKK